MKTTKNLLTLAFAMFATFAFAQSTIVGSSHDFGTNAWWQNGTGEVCITCHTPHGGNTAAGPLWNRVETAATYVLYTNATSSTFDGATTQPLGTSKLCLGCHDGTIDLEAFGGVANGTGTRLTQIVNGNAFLGINLDTHHPVSLTYDTALVTADANGGNNGLNDPTTGTVATLLFNTDQLECASCHDAHDATNNAFLRIDNAGSALCLTCHIK